MKGIFCLETEWKQNINDLKKRSSVQSLLNFFETASKVEREKDVVPYVFRQVATREDFDYYLSHLSYDTYANYDMVYLCFHGWHGQMCFADKEGEEFMDFKKFNNDEKYRNIFIGRNVHFGCCYTLLEDENLIKEFKKHTGARMVTGYTKSVDFNQSFIFELWLLDAIKRKPDYGSVRIYNLAKKDLPVFTKELGFVAY